MIRLAKIAGLALVMGCTSASAQVLMEKNISMPLAMIGFQGAVEECKKSGSNDITIAIVDRAGQVALLARANNASPHNLELARRKAYTARTFRSSTMAWRDRTGRIVYMGAIDDTPSTRLADVKTAHNYVVAALDAVAAGQPVAVASTRAYGCSIKYKDE